MRRNFRTSLVMLARISLVMLAALALAAGCAPLPPQKLPPAPPVTGAPQPPTPAKPTAAAVDSTPSADALAVLGSIPEPLGAQERVPPPDVPVPTGASAPIVAGSSAAAAGASDVPVPGVVPVLGERPPASAQAPVDSAAADTTQVPPTRTEAPPAGPCWRVQVAAPAGREEAEAKRSAAESLLLVPMVIETERGLHKVRTRDCFERSTADRLRERAVDSGFDGAFPLGVPK